MHAFVLDYLRNESTVGTAITVDFLLLGMPSSTVDAVCHYSKTVDIVRLFLVGVLSGIGTVNTIGFV